MRQPRPMALETGYRDTANSRAAAPGTTGAPGGDAERRDGTSPWRRVLPIVATGWQQPPTAPAGTSPTSRPTGLAVGHGPGRTSGPAAGDGFQPGEREEETPAPSCSRGPGSSGDSQGSPPSSIRRVTQGPPISSIRGVTQRPSLPRGSVEGVRKQLGISPQHSAVPQERGHPCG